MARRKGSNKRTGKGTKPGGRKRPERRRRTSRKGPPTPERVLRVLEARAPQLLSPAAVAAALSQGKGASKAIRAVLRELERESRVERVRGRYRAVRAGATLEGRFTRENGGRSGVVIDDGGGVWRVGRVEGVQPGDRVAIEPFGDPTKRRADVLDIVDGARDHWVGLFHRRGKLAYATPYRDEGHWVVRVARNDVGDAEEGEVVRLEPVEGRGRGRNAAATEPWARVVERLGRPGDPTADVAAVVWRRRLPQAFPADVEAEARRAAETPPREDVDRERRDLRAKPFFTIDPASARDHDDAVCVEKLERGWRLYVAIADVAAYVEAGSAIDREALARGNSVYFPTRAIPMLPEALSSDACSLRPEEDRRVLVAELECGARGRVRKSRFYSAWIRSRARLAYPRAAAIMAGESTHALGGPLRDFGALCAKLTERRLRDGALDLDLPSAHLVLGKDGRPVDIVPADRTAAHRAVEEAMLAANRAVAAHLLERGYPAVFRNHDPPAPADAEALSHKLAAFGLMQDGSPLSAAVISAAIGVASDAVARVVNPLVLRAMRQARYGAESRGHFALAFESYVHFTSPIRRYPDLVVHRVLRALLAGEGPPHDAQRVGRMAARSSYRERLAERAEREVRTLAKCAFLTAYVGEELEGTVTGVARHGLYCTFDRWPADGLIHVSRLPEFVFLAEDRLSLIADGSGRRYSLGDRMLVRIAEVDIVEGQVDLEIVRLLEAARERR